MGKYSEMLNSQNSDNKSVLTVKQLNEFEESQQIYGSIDPRKDKTVDHQYWEDILWNAWHFTKPLFYTLHGIRCGGAELTLTRDSFRLLPGEWTTREWDDIKQENLDPVKDKLIWILKLTRFGKVTEDAVPSELLETKPVEPENIEQERMFG